MVGFVLFNFALQIGVHWGNLYPSASQRGEAPQASHYRPLIVSKFDFSTGGIHGDREAELYAKAFVDDYAFKKSLFSKNKLI